MKIEESAKGPKLNLLEPDGVRSQAHADDVTSVLLERGWVSIVPGSFHFYRTAGPKPVPFVQFDVVGDPALVDGLDDQPYRIEVFPTAIAGLAYPVPAEDDSATK